MSGTTGGCLCGAVRFELREAPTQFGACHCSTCQRISGGVNMAFAVKADAIEITGAEAVKTYKSSDWAERSFCGTCGSNLWYRLTTPADEPHEYILALGTLDDASGMTLEQEIWIDAKPASYALTGDHPRKTSAEIFAEIKG